MATETEGGETGVEWRTPDPERLPRRAGQHDDFAQALQGKPGEWAVFRSYAKDAESEPAWNRASSCVAAIKTGRRRSFRPAGDYDAMAQGDGGTVLVFAMYAGPVDEAGDGARSTREQENRS